MPYFLLIPIAHLAMALPINPPGAIGTAEAMYSYLFGLIGVPNGALLSILQRATFIIWAIPGAIIYVTQSRSRHRHTLTNGTMKNHHIEGDGSARITNELDD